MVECDRLAPRTARAIAASALDAWGMPALQDDVALVVSELVTNAFGRGSKLAFLIAFHSGTQEVEVAVWDDGPGLPRARPEDLEAESGRGLLIVRARSNAWGCRPGTGGIGKVVWVRLGPKPREDHDAAS
ncbi:ATP-binding protein [Actinomadura scrupuli]|uniref:ATP-binding protein n=1 Tax=Actinomadura scrupuli TaxID=559629 RepID=UPI003D9539DE